MKARILAAATALVLISACTEREAPKNPLGAPAEAASGQAAAPTIAGDARRALDSANMLFRARSYTQALAQYERSAQLAPQEMAPLLGILMVADATRDARLREATMLRVRKLDPAASESSTVSPHARIPAGHPPLSPPAGQ